MIPEKLGRFEVTEELGRGAMGVVYKATDPKIQRAVALKVINFQQAVSGGDQLQARERFLVEARATGQLSHPNILTIYDVGEEGDLAYIAMEYLEGGDLQDMIDGSKFEDYDQIYDIVRQIADGLDSAHEKGIIHRDIKPANIMMLKGRIPKIADFGLARLADSNLTATGTVLGTPNYMAPEQIQGRKIDGRADLFALGALFYEMLTGEKPFGGETLTSVIYRVVNEEPIPPRQLTMDVPPAMDQFMKKALAKDPNERFQSAKE
ncbi:MAG: serine/threonine-protein kinase, partial [Nitrospinota bacterium]